MPTPLFSVKRYAHSEHKFFERQMAARPLRNGSWSHRICTAAKHPVGIDREKPARTEPRNDEIEAGAKRCTSERTRNLRFQKNVTPRQVTFLHSKILSLYLLAIQISVAQGRTPMKL
jgi:hypothetical protein